MVCLSRFLVRTAVASCARKPPTASTSATFRSHVLLSTSRASSRRSLHTSISRDIASIEPSSVSEVATEPPVDSEWRHPRHGFTAADFPCLVYLNIPRKATEEDLRALVDMAGFPDAQIRVFYDLETGANAYFCYLKLADENQAIAAVSELSRFTLFDFEIRPAKYDAEKFPHWQQPSLFAGWKPSPSSDLNDRVVRPLLTTPPPLLAPLLAEQWIKIENLPPIDLLRKETRFEIVHELYKKFHQYDVVGITKIQPGSRIQGWTCKIQFGSPEEAKAARASHVEAKTFMGRTARAKIFRPGPNINKLLWEYRQSIPEGTSESETYVLMEKKYREVMIRDKPILSRSGYPTSESAIRLKKPDHTLGKPIE